MKKEKVEEHEEDRDREREVQRKIVGFSARKFSVFKELEEFIGEIVLFLLQLLISCDNLI